MAWPKRCTISAGIAGFGDGIGTSDCVASASFLQQQSAGSLPVLSAVVPFRLPRPAAGASAAGRVDVPGAHRGRCGVSGGNSTEQAELCWLRSGQGNGPSYRFVARMVRTLVLPVQPKPERVSKQIDLAAALSLDDSPAEANQEMLLARLRQKLERCGNGTIFSYARSDVHADRAYLCLCRARTEASDGRKAKVCAAECTASTVWFHH
jgi:hypothetical protein